MRPRKWLRFPFLLFLLVYLLLVAGGAVALWFLIPDDVKKVIHDTYLSPR